MTSTVVPRGHSGGSTTRRHGRRPRGRGEWLRAPGCGWTRRPRPCAQAMSSGRRPDAQQGFRLDGEAEHADVGVLRERDCGHPFLEVRALAHDEDVGPVAGDDGVRDEDRGHLGPGREDGEVGRELAGGRLQDQLRRSLGGRGGDLDQQPHAVRSLRPDQRNLRLSAGEGSRALSVGEVGAGAAHDDDLARALAAAGGVEDHGEGGEGDAGAGMAGAEDGEAEEQEGCNPGRIC